jgi:hypothetical protein
MRTPIIIGGGGSINIYTAEQLTPRGGHEGWHRYTLPSIGGLNTVFAAELGNGGRMSFGRDTGPQGPRTLRIWTDATGSGEPQIVVEGRAGIKQPLQVSVYGRPLGEPRPCEYEGYPEIKFQYIWPERGAAELPRHYRLEGPGSRLIRARSVSNAVFEVRDLGAAFRFRSAWGEPGVDPSMPSGFPWWLIGVGAGALLLLWLARQAPSDLPEAVGDTGEPW